VKIFVAEIDGGAVAGDVAELLCPIKFNRVAAEQTESRIANSTSTGAIKH
jgi:hypothetical protein